VTRAARSFARYCAVGVLNLGLNLGVTAFLHEIAHAPEEAAYAAGLLSVFVVNFFVSRHYIYEAGRGPPGIQLGRFALTSGAFRLGEYAAFLLLHGLLGVWYLAAAFVVQVTSFIAKFLVFRTWVFVARDHGASPGA